MRVAWGALSLSTPPTQEEYNYHHLSEPLEDKGNRRRLQRNTIIVRAPNLLVVSGRRGSMAAPRLRCRGLAFPKYWEVRTQGSSDASSGLGCATHARQQHAHALGPLHAASCERCCACHPHRRYFVHLTLRRAYVVVSVYWCTVGGPGGRSASLPHRRRRSITTRLGGAQPLYPTDAGGV